MPPGLLTCTITALAFDLARRSSASTRCRLPRIRPSIVTRAIDPPGPPVRTARLPVSSDRPAHHGDDGDEHRGDPPERQLAPHAAAIDDEIGIERHGLIPSNLIRNAF